MSTPNDRPDGQAWSLRDEIKKRRTQQIIRELESRRTPAARPAYPLPDLTSPLQDSPPVQPIRPRASDIRHLRRRRWWPVALAAVLTFVVMFAGYSSLLARKPGPTPTPTSLALVKGSATDALDYLKRAGMPVFDVRTFTVPNENWRAAEEIQFTTQDQNGAATFLILSYTSASRAGADALRLTSNRSQRFSSWGQMLLSNMLILSSPESAPPVAARVTNHLTYYLAGSAIAILPTVTLQLPSPTMTGAVSAATGTPEPTAILPATETAPAAFTGTGMPTATGTATPAPTETRTATITATAAGTATAFSATIPSTDSPTLTAVPSETATWTPAATITPSGPMMPVGQAAILKFVKAAPPSVGPLTMKRQQTSFNVDGAGLLYETREGARIAVALILTRSAQVALDRYQAEIATIPGAQAVDIGDAAVIAPGSDQILAESRSRNVVLAISYAPGQDPLSPPLTDVQLTALLKALIGAIPK